MAYVVGSKIISKKPHACGGKEWEIVRTGADVKIKCLTCGKALFMSNDQIKKMTKQIIVLNSEDKK